VLKVYDRNNHETYFKTNFQNIQQEAELIDAGYSSSFEEVSNSTSITVKGNFKSIRQIEPERIFKIEIDKGSFDINLVYSYLRNLNLKAICEDLINKNTSAPSSDELNKIL